MDTKVYLCSIELPDGISPDIIRLSRRLSPERQEKIKARHFEKDRLQTLGAGLLLDFGLREYGLRECEAAMAYGANGKPYLADHPHIHFNLSHSRTMVMAVFSDHEAGCDVECISEARMGVARRFFTESELDALEKETDQTQKNQLFFRIWTLKESYIKATGEGMRIPLNSFQVYPSQTLPEYSFQEFTVPGYRAAICLKTPPADSPLPPSAAPHNIFFSFQNLWDVV